MIVAVLMGRKLSKGFPGKNIFKVMGRPLAQYPMMAAKYCPLVDKVYISTDDEALIELAKENGVDTIRRPAGLCTDEALGDDVYVHAYDLLRKRYKNIELFVLLMCNAATITAETITEGIEALRKNKSYDSAVTVSKYNMWSPLRARSIGPGGLVRSFIPFETFGDPKTLNCDRDSQGDVWFADMGVSIVRPRCLEHIHSGLLPQRWMGTKIYPLKQWGGLDVDYVWQIPSVEWWLRANGFSDSRTPYDRKGTVACLARVDAIYRTPPSETSRHRKMRLDKNEHTSGIGKSHLKNVLSSIDPEVISSYPESEHFYGMLARSLRIKREELILTNGSDGAIKSVFEAFINPGDRVIIVHPTYAMFYVYCDLFGAEKVQIDFDENLDLPVDKILEAIDPTVRLVALPNPNSPTGTVIEEKDLVSLIKKAGSRGSVVLIDEAYHGFYPKTMLGSIRRYDNLIVTRTFSKAYALAGLRLGYAVANPAIIRALYNVKPMYEANAVALRFAEYVLKHPSMANDYIRECSLGKEYLAGRFRSLGFAVHKSHANFLVVKMPGINNSLAAKLGKRGVLVKGGYDAPGLRDTIRVTVGPKRQMAEFFRIFQKCL